MNHLTSVLGLGSAALLFQAGCWIATIVHEPPARERARLDASGAANGREAITAGRGSGPAGASWSYASKWWERFRTVNLTGWLPPPPPPPPPPGEVRHRAETTLDQVAELVSAAYDGPAAGRGGDTHVVIRYLPAAEVQPPEEFLVHVPAAAPAAQIATPGGKPRRADKLPAAAPAVPEYVQLLRIGDALWPPLSDYSLAEVGPHADRARFVRTGSADGQEPRSFELSLGTMRTSAWIREILEQIRGKDVVKAAAAPPRRAAAPWVDVAETTKVDGTVHIGRRDAEAFAGDGQERVLERVDLAPWVSRTDPALRGMQVRQVDAALGGAYGVQGGDVLLSVNGTPVRGKAELLQVLRTQYNLGTRTFTTRWLVLGREVERVYQAPPGRNPP